MSLSSKQESAQGKRQIDALIKSLPGRLEAAMLAGDIEAIGKLIVEREALQLAQLGLMVLYCQVEVQEWQRRLEWLQGLRDFPDEAKPWLEQVYTQTSQYFEMACLDTKNASWIVAQTAQNSAAPILEDIHTLIATVSLRIYSWTVIAEQARQWGLVPPDPKEEA
jgi:hypothetical protein